LGDPRLAGGEDRHGFLDQPFNHAVAGGARHRDAADDADRIRHRRIDYLCRGGGISFSRDTDKRWRDTFFFGFIHGFGFASGLKELNVQQQTIVPALASFNIGVEIGQIVIVLLLMPIFLFIDRWTGGKRDERLVYGSPR